MKRKIMILTIAFLSSVLMCANVFAAASGRCGNSITWTLDDLGNLTLSGSGEMWNYYGNDDSPFKGYEIRKATVEYGITSIGEYAFVGCSGMTELALPNSVASIRGNAFEGCSGLTELTLPNSVTSIGGNAFEGCSGLTELTLPNSVTRIWEGAFRGCSGLTKLTLSHSVTRIWNSAFEGCSGLTELTLPNSITSIGCNAFMGCNGLTELTLPNTLECIELGAFRGCTGLTELTLPNSITRIEESAFEGCSGLTELTLPNSLESIEDSAFEGCRGLTELTLPNSVTRIGEGAFRGCSGLTKLTLSHSVKSIRNSAFEDCIGLEKVTSFAEIPPVCSSNVFDGVNKINCELIVQIVSVVAYKQAEGWNEFSNITAATVRCGDSITWTLDDSGNLTLSGSGEMWNYDTSPFKDYEIRKATIEDGITSIGNGAFAGCSGLTVQTLPSSVTSIGDGAFAYCSGLTELTLPNSITSIGGCAFYDCTGLTELTLPDSLERIEESAFEGCSGLTELTLPNSVTSIERLAFAYCSGLEKITVDGGNKRYDSRDNCNSIIDTETNTLIAGCKNSVIPNSVTSIGDCAFWGCIGLTELTLSHSVKSIGNYAFVDCSGLSKITSLAEIPPECYAEVFNGVNKTNCELIVPVISVTAYKQAEGWNEFSNIRGFSGVDVTEADGNTIRAIGNQIEISGYFTSVEVYGINGALIYKGKDNVVTVPSAGIYLVHVAGKTRKIVVE